MIYHQISSIIPRTTTKCQC